MSDLKRFAEAGGWTWYADDRDPSESFWEAPDKNRTDELPDFPNDLQACVEVLEHYCLHRNVLWSLSQVKDDCEINGLHFNVVIDDFKRAELPEGCGATPQLAIIAAVLRAEEGRT